MSPSDVGGLIGSAFSSVVTLVVFFCLGTIVLFWPLMAWSVMRNVRLIRLQLERLNDTIESRRSVSGGGPLGL